jgi:Glycosyl hydrolases family 32 N-terminal domain
MSPDLIHWKHLPIALSPTADSFDSYGTFTGSVLPDGEGASVIYTGVTKVPAEEEAIRNEGLWEVQCIATSTDADLRTWHKLATPVIERPPLGLKITGFRDPGSWKDGDAWYVGVGSGFSKIGGLCCSIVRRMPANGSTFTLSRREHGTESTLQIRSPVVRCGSALTSFRYKRTEKIQAKLRGPPHRATYWVCLWLPYA